MISVGRRTAVLLLGMAFAAPCAAQFSIGAGIEQFTWSERVSPSVEERGPVFGLWVQYLQPKPSGWLLGYQGKFYSGDVTYRGALLDPPHAPVTGTTSYSGMWHELQVRRRGESRNRLALFLALGIDQWRRQLSLVQQEDYTIGYFRLGAESDSIEDIGWIAAAGIKQPFYTNEDAQFTSIGGDRNPPLKPGKNLSLYAQLGYRITRDVSIIGYTDGYRFGESEPVYVVRNGKPGYYYQPASTLQVYGVRIEYRFL